MNHQNNGYWQSDLFEYINFGFLASQMARIEIIISVFGFFMRESADGMMWMCKNYKSQTHIVHSTLSQNKKNVEIDCSLHTPQSAWGLGECRRKWNVSTTQPSVAHSLTERKYDSTNFSNTCVIGILWFSYQNWASMKSNRILNLKHKIFAPLPPSSPPP